MPLGRSIFLLVKRALGMHIRRLSETVARRDREERFDDGSGSSSYDGSLVADVHTVYVLFRCPHAVHVLVKDVHAVRVLVKDV